jgi:hypothetical protein
MATTFFVRPNVLINSFITHLDTLVLSKPPGTCSELHFTVNFDSIDAMCAVAILMVLQVANRHVPVDAELA